MADKELVVVLNKEHYENSGFMSQYSWRSLMPVLRDVFACRDNEVITGLKITELGITAVFKRI